MPTLKEHDWSSINEILLEIYTLDTEFEIADRFLKMLAGIVFYDKAFFVMCNENNDIISENSAFINIDENIKNNYIENFYDIDYIKYITNITKSVVFKDTDIIEDETRSKTKIYREFLAPNGMDFGAGTIFVKNDKMLGILNLFRKIEMGDFSEKELHILNLLKDHIANILYSLRKNSITLDGKKEIDLSKLENYNLSKRENEIIELMLYGLSNAEISEQLVISISTVKKHVYNIFTKLGINSRLQLLKLSSKE